jgi:hypothetical protein
MSKRRLSTEVRAQFVRAAQRRLDGCGWTINPRSLNASIHAPILQKVIVYYDPRRKNEVGFSGAMYRAGVMDQARFAETVKSLSEIMASMRLVRTVLDDLHRWIEVDHLEGMAHIEE